MKKIIYKFNFIIISALLFVACNTKPPISEEKFIKIYVDLLIIQDTTTIRLSSIDSLKNVVYSKHNITPKDYLNTLKYYKSSPEKWEKIFDKVIAYAEEMRDSSGKKP